MLQTKIRLISFPIRSKQGTQTLGMYKSFYGHLIGFSKTFKQMLGFLLCTKRTIAVSPKGKTNTKKKERRGTPLTRCATSYKWGGNNPLKMAENKWVTGVVITPFFGRSYIYIYIYSTRLLSTSCFHKCTAGWDPTWRDRSLPIKLPAKWSSETTRCWARRWFQPDS